MSYLNSFEQNGGWSVGTKYRLRIATQEGWRKVVFESDCQVLVNMWQTRGQDRSEIMGLLQETEELSRSFISFSLRFVRREANFCAHLCAKIPIDTDRRVWREAAPVQLSACIQTDCMANLE